MRCILFLQRVFLRETRCILFQMRQVLFLLSGLEVKYWANVSWQSLSSLNPWLNTQYIILPRIEYQESSQESESSKIEKTISLSLQWFLDRLIEQTDCNSENAIIIEQSHSWLNSDYSVSLKNMWMYPLKLLRANHCWIRWSRSSENSCNIGRWEHFSIC